MGSSEEEGTLRVGASKGKSEQKEANDTAPVRYRPPGHRRLHRRTAAVEWRAVCAAARYPWYHRHRRFRCPHRPPHCHRRRHRHRTGTEGRQPVPCSVAVSWACRTATSLCASLLRHPRCTVSLARRRRRSDEVAMVSLLPSSLVPVAKLGRRRSWMGRSGPARGAREGYLRRYRGKVGVPAAEAVGKAWPTPWAEARWRRRCQRRRRAGAGAAEHSRVVEAAGVAKQRERAREYGVIW